MPRACCVPKCRTGHRRRKNDPKPKPGPKPSLHLFPRDKVLRERWRQSIPFYKHKPGDHTYVCSLHFLKSDYGGFTSNQEEASDLKKITLKKGAKPSVFPELLDLQARLDEVSQLDDDFYVRDFQNDDEGMYSAVTAKKSLPTINSLQDLQDNLDLKLLSLDIVHTYHEGTSYSAADWTFMMVTQDHNNVPTLKFSLKIGANLEYEIWCHQIRVHKCKVKHILESDRINSAMQVIQLLEFLKSYSMSEAIIKDKVDQALYLLQEGTWSLPEPKRNIINGLIHQIKEVV